MYEVKYMSQLRIEKIQELMKQEISNIILLEYRMNLDLELILRNMKMIFLLRVNS